MTLTMVKKINYVFGNRELSSVCSRRILKKIDNSIFNIKLLEKMTASKYQQYLNSQSMSEVQELNRADTSSLHWKSQFMREEKF